MSDRVLLKLGGSVITDKSGSGSIRHEEITRISETIAATGRDTTCDSAWCRFMRSPGSESFQDRAGVSRENREGIYYTHTAVRNLNDYIVEALRNGRN